MVNIAVGVCFLIMVIYYLKRRRHLDSIQFSKYREFCKLKVLIWTILSFLLLFLLNVFVFYKGYLGVSMDTSPLDTLEPKMIYLICFVPIVEELSTRHLLLYVVLKKVPKSLAVIISALVFAVLHDLEIYTLSFFFIYGVFLGVVYLVGNNIWVIMSIHLWMDFTSYFTSLLRLETGFFLGRFLFGKLTVLENGIVFSVFMILLYLLARYSKKIFASSCQKNIS